MRKTINEQEIQRLIYERKERLKELACINQSTQIIREGKSLVETLIHICTILPDAWQYPEETVARIQFDGQVYTTANFHETEWRQGQEFRTINNKQGEVEVFYLTKLPDCYEGPFLKEERDLINNLAMIISNYINSLEAREALQEARGESVEKPEISEFKKPIISSRQLLQKYLNKQNANRDIFHDLMPYKVKEILLVATLYDAYSIEKEGRFSEHILGEYHQMNLTSMPRVTGVSTYEEAVEQLESKHIDLVILMIGNDRKTPIQMGIKVKQDYPYIPVFVLLNNDREVSRFKETFRRLDIIDKIFVWNGDSKIFFAMVKHLEDKVNVESDTKKGLVKVILLVEDSEQYYSRYLPMLYTKVLEQSKKLIEEASTDDLFKVLSLRARPKILLATTYEEAIRIFNKYRDDLLCLITDVKFERNGKLDDQAGFSLVTQVREQAKNLPAIIQSSDIENSHKAFELKSIFINKNSESLLQDIESFIRHNLGFGNFIYKDTSGKTLAVARTLREFESLIDIIPIESLIYHGRRNHFSLWLMARGEIKIAKMIQPVKVTDFKSPLEFRNYLKFIIRKYRNETNIGKVINFEETAIPDETNIVSLGTGALGGKGRGLSFINTLIYNLNFGEILPEINIRTPITTIIGTDEFDIFLDRNNLREVIHSGNYYRTIKEEFLKGSLSYTLEKKLRALLKLIRKPLAIRSSSLLEDSTAQPFSGVFATYLLPNNHPDFHTRLQQTMDAIKLVYASIYSDNARDYFEAVNYKVDDEKMAVIIQEVVGNQFDNLYYPHISGTAQSYNYYPVAQMKPGDGYAVAAIGLGQYVVEGRMAYRFCPRYPDMETNTPRGQFKTSQLRFYAIDMQNKVLELLEKEHEASLCQMDISEAEKHGTLKHCASVYDAENDRIVPGLDSPGPRIINFADILKFGYIPLSKAIDLILNVVKEALGAPVEIEYAVDLKLDSKGNASFYLLQIKPLLGSADDFHIDLKKIKKEQIIMFAERSMGNGRIEDIRDIIYVEPAKFDKTKTKEIIPEIESLNARMIEQQLKYVLIGPGRWGTRDRFIGIPVAWPQISNARVIVEVSLEDFPLDASQGSHFFHNLTSMNVGYFSVDDQSGKDVLDWKILSAQQVVNETRYLRHIRFKKPLTIVMDGEKRISVITWDNNITQKKK
jgi:hypothetical protein